MPEPLPVEFGSLEDVIKDTVYAVERSREQISEITDTARAEVRRIRLLLDEARTQSAEAQALVEQLEKERDAQDLYLMNIKRDFYKCTREDVDEAYRKVRDLDVKIAVAREKAARFEDRRRELELTRLSLDKINDRADRLLLQVGSLLERLSESLSDFCSQIDGIKEKKQIGVRVIKAQEDERRRVAREIHDGPAQTMANVVLRAEICLKMMAVDPSKVGPELEELKRSVKESLQEIRRIIFDLRPMLLDDLGLGPALRRYLEDFRDKTKIQCDLVITGKEERLDPVLEVAVFRLVQEALNNVKKHAAAHKVEVRIGYSPSYITVVVQDDGKGFDVSSLRLNTGTPGSTSGFGLVGMKERVKLLSGTFEIQSAPGEGTRIQAQIPLDA